MTPLPIFERGPLQHLSRPVGDIQDGRPRAAVLIEPVSADSLPKTEMFAETAGEFRRFPPQLRQSQIPETEAHAQKTGSSGPFSPLLGSLAGGREGLDPRCGELQNRMLCLPERSRGTEFLLHLISLSKHSNFENRTESAESRALERRRRFGEE
jgi:hypothetical protein